MGNRRFEEIQAQTGMSSHLLSTRLRRLEEDKILERRVYSARPLRHEYLATPKGKDLDGVILALRNWDLRWGGSDGKGAAAMILIDKRTGKVIDGNWQNPDGETFSFSNTTSVMSAAWKAERDADAAAFYSAKQRSTPRTSSVSATSTKASTRSSARKLTGAKRTSVKTMAAKPVVRRKAVAIAKKTK